MPPVNADYVNSVVTRPREHTGFYDRLILALMVADAGNRMLLAQIYPDHVRAVNEFRARKLAGMTRGAAK